MEGGGCGGIKFTDGNEVVEDIPEHFCQLGPLHRLISTLGSWANCFLIGKKKDQKPYKQTNKQPSG